MRSVKVNEVIDKSKFNKFFLSVFLVLIFALVFDGYDQGVYGTSLPVLMKDTGLSATIFGMIGSYTLYGMMAGGIIFGMLSDKIGRRITLMLGILLYCLGTGLFGLAHTVTEFTIYRVLAGIGLAGISPVVLSLATEYSPAANRATFVSLTTAGIPIGMMLAPLIGMGILPGLGWRPMFLLGLIPLFMIALVLIFLPESMDMLIRKGEKKKISKILTQVDAAYIPNESDEYMTNTTSATKAKSASFTSLFKEGLALNTILFWIIFSTMMFTLYGMTTWLPKLMTNAGYPLGNSLWFMFTFTLGGLPSIAVSGSFVNKFGYKKTIVSYALMAAALIVFLAIKTNFIILTILLFLIGGGIYGAMGLIFTYAAINYPNTIRGTGVGWASAVGRLGGSFGPMIGGILIANKASLAMNFLTFAIAMGIAAIAVIMSKDYSKVKVLNASND